MSRSPVVVGQTMRFTVRPMIQALQTAQNFYSFLDQPLRPGRHLRSAILINPDYGLLVRLRQAEVQQLGACLRQHHVAGLEVPVNDAGLVRGREGIGDLDAVVERLVEWQLPACEAGRECLPVQSTP